MRRALTEDEICTELDEPIDLPDWEEEDYTTPNKQFVFNAWCDGEPWAERIMVEQNWESDFLERLR